MTPRCEVHEVDQFFSPGSNDQNGLKITIWDHYVDDTSRKEKYLIVIIFIIVTDRLDL